MSHTEHQSEKRFKDLIFTPDLPGLGPAPRASRFPLTELNGKLELFFAAASLPEELRLPLHSAALLWHDYLDESHAISQELHGAEGSLLHAIMHRREPDYGNAKYWFHRVGSHSCFPTIAERVTPFLEAKNERALLFRLVPNGRWEPFAFVDACEAASEQTRVSLRGILGSIQEIEFNALLGHLFAGTSPNRVAPAGR